MTDVSTFRLAQYVVDAYYISFQDVFGLPVNEFGLGLWELYSYQAASR